jgi:hypothetical protein
MTTGLRDLLRSMRLSLGMLLGRRLGLFVAIDALVVGGAVLQMLLEREGEAADLYRFVFLIPSLILALPALAGIVDLERRAGCLDLALSAPSAEGYFLRRAGAVCAVTAIQGWLVMLLGWFLDGYSFPILPPLAQVAVVSLLLGAVSLFWAVRLRTAGAVWLASTVSLCLLGKWFFFNPIPPRYGEAFGSFLPGPEKALAWLGSAGVLAAASALFFLYARRRLRRPELIIS